jgi:phosphatidylglycerophosphate synthase
MTKGTYSYAASIKSDASDELINTYLLRPIAGVLVAVLYPTSVTPNHLTLAGIAIGVMAAMLYLTNLSPFIAAAGLCVTLKDLLDSADGQLARAKQLYSRRGRFLDSIGDVVVNILVFGAIGYVVVAQTGNLWLAVLAAMSLVGTTLRVSYHVFYQTSFLHLQGSYQMNRLSEEVTPGDLAGDRTTLMLQRVFQAIYGWQDRLMGRLDRWSRRGKALDDDGKKRWYGDRRALQLTGFAGLSTELFALMIFSVFAGLVEYLYWNTVVMNGFWLVCLGYRRCVLGAS